MASPNPSQSRVPLGHLGWQCLGTVTEDQPHRITVNPEICHGKPTVRGLRYPVEMILDLLSAGMTSAEILIDYPDLEAADITAVLQYAAQLARVHRGELLSA